MKAVLDIVAQIVEGFSTPFTNVHMALLDDVLLPLHDPNSRVAGRGGALPMTVSPAAIAKPADGQPLLSSYHASLVSCETSFAKRDPAVAVRCIRFLLATWPVESAGASQKEVLLLHEVEKLLEFADDAGFAAVLPDVVARLASSISCQFAQISQRALQFWKSDNFLARSKSHHAIIMPTILPSCYRGPKAHWNTTVNRLSATVLAELHNQNQAMFKALCEQYFPVGGGGGGVGTGGAATATPAAVAAGAAADEEDGYIDIVDEAGGAVDEDGASTGSVDVPKQVGRGGGKFRAPGGSKWSGGANQPPATITGVAPWAKKTAGSPAAAFGGSSMSSFAEDGDGGGSGEGPPPATPAVLSASASASAAAEDGTKRQRLNGADDGEAAVAVAGLPLDSLGVVLAFIDKYRVVAAQVVNSMDAMTETPTLLPTLKFHELVYGHDLGSGAFSTVKYAKQIVRGVANTEWPQFAVKIMAIEKILELGYEEAISREIAILRVMSHPGIARLVASFRWRDGAYLVLEYASKGDLHGFISTNGSLDAASAQFVAGEVLAGLASIHKSGFVFGDLKPENVVLTAEGHTKIADFGASRPYTDTAKEYIKKNKDVIKQLRDGDHAWRSKLGGNAPKAPGGESGSLKPRGGGGISGSLGRKPASGVSGSLAKPAAPPPDAVVEGEAGAAAKSANQQTGVPAEDVAEKEEDAAVVEEEEKEDTRVEGTAVYLAPEVAKGGYPTPASDCWALGCLLFQCLTGRPPIWAETVPETLAAVVKFKPTNDHFPDNFPADAKDLVMSLLEPDVDSRETLAGAAKHKFFKGTDVFKLFSSSAPELVRGAAEPQPDARWQRRQQSMLWQPMPAAFSASTGAAVINAIVETAAEAAAPFCQSIGSISERA